MPNQDTGRTGTAHLDAALEFLTRLGTDALECGYATAAAEDMVRACAAAWGLSRLTVTGMGRVLIVQCEDGQGHLVSRMGESAGLDSFDCDRMRRVKAVARATVTERLDPETACRRLTDADSGPPVFPWWWVQAGGMLLAFCICVQIGGGMLAASAAAVIQLAVNVTGRGFGAWGVPKLFGVAVQAALAGSLGGLCHLADWLTVAQAATVVATTWVLIAPLPQLISTAIDMVSGDSMSALVRALGAGLIIGGIVLGGLLVLSLSWRFDLGVPVSADLPVLPVWLGVVFAVLGAIGNALFNAGGKDLLLPAAVAGLVTASVNQTLIHLGNMPSAWAGPIAAVVLGFLAAACADRLRLPMSALALVGITGALLPGLIVCQGLMLSVYQVSGVQYFVQAGAVCVALGVGASLGVYLWAVVARRGRAVTTR
ncbi:threonine/serine exporter family protein [Nocardia rosealba]|uniref:threonine/serine exporter family protein n=1 Tax=Nocardia rosealba TaxID=2878563 RepID=UPI001CD9F30C|nr:threonine/serine exporter family protein [Nocardia rosealba]MCA2207615.1 threonine/serine exporter family protein [Nocardia rosealba]